MIFSYHEGQQQSPNSMTFSYREGQQYNPMLEANAERRDQYAAVARLQTEPHFNTP